MSRVAIVGSRHFRGYKLVSKVIERYVAVYGDIEAIITDGCRGTDQIAETYARNSRIPCEVYPADWQHFGKRAAYLRNQKIVDDADTVIAFVLADKHPLIKDLYDKQVNRGTTMTTTLAVKANKRIWLCVVENDRQIRIIRDRLRIKEYLF